MLFDLGNYDLFFCSFDPESYTEAVELNSCPDIVSTKVDNKKIWYFINQSSRKKYKLMLYQKNDIIVLKGKRKEKGKTLIFKKQI